MEYKTLFDATSRGNPKIQIGIAKNRYYLMRPQALTSLKAEGRSNAILEC